MIEFIGHEAQQLCGQLQLLVSRLPPSKIVFQVYSFTRLSLSELLITETELKLIAAAAIIGDNSIPKNGYNRPAAIGTPTEL